MDEKEVEQLKADFAALKEVEKQLRGELAASNEHNLDLQATLARNAARVWELREELDTTQRALAAVKPPA